MSCPIPQWLYLKMLTEPARPDAAAVRAQAAAAIELIDRTLARHRPSRSCCGRCRTPIEPPTWRCPNPNCGTDYAAAVMTRAAADAKQYGLSKVDSCHGLPVEFSHHDGAVLGVR